jgi:hypothetical protein
MESQFTIIPRYYVAMESQFTIIPLLCCTYIKNAKKFSYRLGDISCTATPTIYWCKNIPILHCIYVCHVEGMHTLTLGNQL